MIRLYELARKVRFAFRRGLSLLLACLFCTAAGMTARAYEPAERMLIPVGHTVGVKLFSKGVVVVRFPEGNTPAKNCGLQTGDVIERCDGVSVTSTEQFRALLQENGPASTELVISRDGSSMTLCVEPERNEEGLCCIGAWIRDSMAGIGTVTYLDPLTGQFGALGHGVSDVDTAQLMPFSNGSVLPSTVKTVKKGISGCAGALKGDFDLSREQGILYANTSSGIFGHWTDPLPAANAVPVGAAHEGEATVLSNVEGDTVGEYTVEITDIRPGADNGCELVLRVTDSKLLDLTGGIVQGMSGSPILQDGKIVGAVTHVLLSNPEKGYGILIETMLNAAGGANG